MNIIAKWLIFIVLITILIAGTSIYFNYKVKKTSDTLSIHMDKIRNIHSKTNGKKLRTSLKISNKTGETEKLLDADH